MMFQVGTATVDEDKYVIWTNGADFFVYKVLTKGEVLARPVARDEVPVPHRLAIDSEIANLKNLEEEDSGKPWKVENA